MTTHKKTLLTLCLLAGLLTSRSLAQSGSVPAPTRVASGAVICLPEDDFGMALAAAILKKKVPVSVTHDAEKATFILADTSTASRESAGERVAKVLAFGAFAGSGKRFEATVTVTNRDGVIVFAHNSKKENFQSAAENVANELRKHVLQR